MTLVADREESRVGSDVFTAKMQRYAEVVGRMALKVAQCSTSSITSASTVPLPALRTSASRR